MDKRPENDSAASREETVSSLCRAYAEALLTGDEIAAEHVIRDAIDTGLGTPAIDDEIIAPALWLVGELWQRGEISVADEHLATEISLRVLALQREAQRVIDSRGRHRVLLATPAGELHVVALRMVGNLLRDAGYDVYMLGPDVPHDALAATARQVRPDVICLSTTMPSGSDQILVAIHETQREWAGAGYVVGGRGLTSRVQPRPGLAICRRVGDGVEAVDAMVRRADRN